MATEQTLREKLIDAGLCGPHDFDRHASDLYVRANPGVAEWLKAHGYRFKLFIVSPHHPNSGQAWFDVPFMA